MNPSKQLFLIGAILFLFLGINQRKAGDGATYQPEPERIAYEAFRAGILPANAAITFESFVFTRLFFQPGGYSGSAYRGEIPASLNTLNRFHQIISRVLKYRPGIREKTGIFIHLQADKEGPLLS